jgi:hypothetical protein
MKVVTGDKEMLDFVRSYDIMPEQIEGGGWLLLMIDSGSDDGQ